MRKVDDQSIPSQCFNTMARAVAYFLFVVLYLANIIACALKQCKLIACCCAPGQSSCTMCPSRDEEPVPMHAA